MSPRMWLWILSLLSWAAAIEQSFPSRGESQLPAATLTLESFLGSHLGCCASAVWTLHRANASHNVNFPWLLTSFRIRDIGSNSCPIWESVAFTCSCDFICISGSTTLKENLPNGINQLKFPVSWSGNSVEQSDFFR
jgi:hypothetical protein